MENTYFLGLDVSKRTIMVCLLDLLGSQQRIEILNSHSGFEQLLAWLHGIAPETVHACLEPTGRYSQLIALFLLQHGFKVSQVNSYVVQCHGRSKGIRNKHDRIDAYLLADFCLKERPPAWIPAEKAQTELREIESRIQALDDMILQERNRLEAGITNSLVRQSIENHVAQLEASKEAFEKEASNVAAGDSVLKQNLLVISSIIGLGERSSLRLLAFVHFARLKNPRSAGCFAGLTPRKYESGTSVHKREAISRVGSSELRRFLYFPAMVAINCNPQMRAFAERLKAKGKAPKVVICAVMRKLLVLAATLVRKQQLYDCTHGLAPN